MVLIHDYGADNEEGEQKRAGETANFAELISNILKSCKKKDKKEEP